MMLLRGEESCMVSETNGADFFGSIGCRRMGIVARAAPELAAAVSGARTEGQLLRVTDHLQGPVRGLSRDIDRVSLLEALAGLKVRHALSRVWNAYLPR